MKKHNKYLKLFKEMVSVLMLLQLCFGVFLAVNTVYINNQSWSILLDLKPDEFLYYPFIASMNMVTGVAILSMIDSVEKMFLLKLKTLT